MKKILAVLLALAMICVLFAACGSSKEEETTTTQLSDEDLFGDYEDEGTSATEAAAVTDADGNTVTDASAADASAVTDADGNTVTDASAADASTTAAEDDPANWDTAKIVEYYNAARKNTSDDIKGHQTMALSGEITGDGAIGTVLKVLQPAAKSALENNSKDLTGVPAKDHADIKVSDVKKAAAKKNSDGNIVITMSFNDQTDGADGDDKDGGPVARGVGTLGSIDSALDALGAEITDGRDTVKLTYTNAYIKDCVIDAKTQTIKSGTYHYTVNVSIANAKAKLGITATLKNLKATIDYTRTVG